MSANVLTNEQALAMVQAAEMNFGSGNVPAILDGFTDDVVIQFADVPEIHGKADAKKFLNARFSRQKNYQLKKTMRMLQGNMVGNFWDGTWEDAQTGRRMTGRGTEFWKKSTNNYEETCYGHNFYATKESQVAFGAVGHSCHIDRLRPSADPRRLSDDPLRCGRTIWNADSQGRSNVCRRDQCNRRGSWSQD